MPLSGAWDVVTFVLDLLDLVCNWRFVICLALGLAVGALLRSSMNDPVAASIANGRFTRSPYRRRARSSSTQTRAGRP